jgi:hypothetical protein
MGHLSKLQIEIHLGFTCPLGSFTFEQLFKMFSLRYQNLYVNFFYACLDFGSEK